MSLYVDCPFCHKSIFKFFMSWHVKKHTRLLPDGQMTNHVTMKERERHQGSLENVPQVYVHSVCGGGTGMPEEIIRSYLANPFLYSHRTFCTGCNDYVHMGECEWSETGQQVLEYRRNLMKGHLGGKPMLYCSPQFVQQAKARRQTENASSSAMLRLSIVEEGNQCRLKYFFVDECDPESDWRGEFFGLSVVVDYDESASYLCGQTLEAF